MVGLKVPIVNMVHQYLVTESILEVNDLEKEIPVVRDPWSSCYYRQEQQGLVIGPYEMNAEAWGLDGIDWSFDNALLPPDTERLEPHLEKVAERIPVFGDAGIKRVVSGPITHTPDGNFLLGPAPGLKNFWMCCGASIGITQGAGAGKYLAQWMIYGQTEINVREMDARRFGDWAAGRYTLEKAVDDYEHMYQVHYPGEFREPGRTQRTTPVYETLKTKGAVFGEIFGWERAKWFDPNQEGEQYSFKRNNSFNAVAAECKAVREHAGLLDLSSFAKFDIQGEDATSFLNRLCANRIPKKAGGISLVHLLTDLGGIECEGTVARLSKDVFYFLSAAVAEIHDEDWLDQQRLPGERVEISNVTNDYGVLVLTGPRSRDILKQLTDADLSNEAFPWLRCQEIEVAGIPTRALRVSYVGELGWELHHPMERMQELYDQLHEAGTSQGLRDFGTYAVNSLRMEKAYKAWGGELTTEITPVEADLLRFVDFSKSFTGREATLARKLQSTAMQLVYLSLDSPETDCLGNEPVFDGEKMIGVTTGGAYGHTVSQSLAFAYVPPDYAAPGTRFEIPLLGARRSATVIPEAVYDPNNDRLKHG
jgi:dimethylglycine dehydrogenase